MQAGDRACASMHTHARHACKFASPQSRKADTPAPRVQSLHAPARTSCLLQQKHVQVNGTPSLAQLSAPTTQEPGISSLATWETLSDALITQRASPSSLLAMLLRATPPAPTAPTHRFPTLLPQLLDACRPELAALQHLLHTESPWQPKAGTALTSSRAHLTTLEELWEEHDASLDAGFSPAELLNGIGSMRQAQEQQQVGVRDAQEAMPPQQKLQLLKQKLGVGGSSSSTSSNNSTAEQSASPDWSRHSSRGATDTGVHSSMAPGAHSTTPLSLAQNRQQGTRAQSLAADSMLRGQRLSVLQLSLHAARCRAELQPAEAATFALLLAQQAHASGLTTTAPNNGLLSTTTPHSVSLRGQGVEKPSVPAPNKSQQPAVAAAPHAAPPTPLQEGAQSPPKLSHSRAVQDSIGSLLCHCLSGVRNTEDVPRSSSSSSSSVPVTVHSCQLSMLAAAAIAAALAGCPYSFSSADPLAEAQGSTNSSKSSSSSGDGGESSSGGSGQDDCVFARVRQLSLQVWGSSGDNSSGSSMRGNSAALGDRKDSSSSCSNSSSKDVGRVKQGEVTAALLWAHGVAGQDLGACREARSWAESALHALQPCLQPLSTSALLDVMWALSATELLPLPAKSRDHDLGHDLLAPEPVSAGRPASWRQQVQQQQQQLPSADAMNGSPPPLSGHSPPRASFHPTLSALLYELSGRRRLAGMNGKQLVALLVSLAQAGLRLYGRDSLRVLFALDQRTGSCASLSSHQLAMAAWALAKTRTRVKAQMMHRLLERFHALLPHATAADAATLIWALPLATKGHTLLAAQQEDLMHAISDFTLPHLVVSAQHKTQGTSKRDDVRRCSCGPQQLVQLAVGYMRLRFYPGAEWMRLHREACIAWKQEFTQTERMQLRAAYRTLLEA